MNGEMVGISKEALLPHFVVIHHHFCGKTEINRKLNLNVHIEYVPTSFHPLWSNYLKQEKVQVLMK
jgi:hypothetical protein